jgi:sulfatase maturation enzyme AslB (radical SAM superfamily)
VHGSGRTDPAVALSFIRHCLSRWPDRKLIVDFFGGEPLLEFETLVQVVREVVGLRRTSHLEFGLTTNGLLLSPEVWSFLNRYNFYCSVSLDGTREIHNRNRVFADGRDSYDKVFANLQYARTHFPEYYQNRIQLMATLEKSEDVLPTLNAFSKLGAYNSQYRAVKPDYRLCELSVPRFRMPRRALQNRSIRAYISGNIHEALLYGSDLLQFCIGFDKRTVFTDGGVVNGGCGSFCEPYSASVTLQTNGALSFCNFAETHQFGRFAAGKFEFDEMIIRDLRQALGRYRARHCELCWVRKICRLCWVHFLDSEHKPNEGKLSLHCTQEKRRLQAYIRYYIAQKIRDNRMFDVIERMIPARNRT